MAVLFGFFFGHTDISEEYCQRGSKFEIQLRGSREKLSEQLLWRIGEGGTENVNSLDGTEDETGNTSGYQLELA
jgi:hypothetical protein